MRLFNGAIAIVVSLLLVSSPVLAGATNPASQAVINTARQLFANAYHTAQLGNASAAWASAAAAAQILFAHYNEVGLTASEQRRILSDPAAFIKFQLSAIQIQAPCARLEGKEISVPCSQVANRANSTTEERRRVVDLVRSEGLAALEGQIVTILQSMAFRGTGGTAFRELPSTNAKLRSAVFSLKTCDGVRLRPVQITGENCTNLKRAIVIVAFLGEGELVLILGLICIEEGCC